MADCGALPERTGGCNLETLVHNTGPHVPEHDRNPAFRLEPCYRWSISTTRSPVLVDPANGRLWTANARVVDDEGLAVLGDGGYALGARSKQIRDGLLAKPGSAKRICWRSNWMTAACSCNAGGSCCRPKASAMRIHHWPPWRKQAPVGNRVPASIRSVTVLYAPGDWPCMRALPMA